MEITEECLVMFYANSCEIQVLHYILMSSGFQLGGTQTRMHAHTHKHAYMHTHTHTKTRTHVTLYLQWGWQQQADSPSRGSMLRKGVERRRPRCHAPEEYTQTYESLIGLKKAKKKTKKKHTRKWCVWDEHHSCITPFFHSYYTSVCWTVGSLTFSHQVALFHTKWRCCPLMPLFYGHLFLF